MLKKTVKYVDYNGIERTEDFYFNLNKAEVTEMEFSIKDGLSTNIQAMVDSQDKGKIFTLFKEILLKAYGVKSEDGKRFVKNAELREAFEQCEAFSEILTELGTDEAVMTAFINGILPSIPSKI